MMRFAEYFKEDVQNVRLAMRQQALAHAHHRRHANHKKADEHGKEYHRLQSQLAKAASKQKKK